MRTIPANSLPTTGCHRLASKTQSFADSGQLERLGQWYLYILLLHIERHAVRSVRGVRNTGWQPQVIETQTDTGRLIADSTPAPAVRSRPQGRFGGRSQCQCSKTALSAGGSSGAWQSGPLRWHYLLVTLDTAPCQNNLAASHSCAVIPARAARTGRRWRTGCRHVAAANRRRRDSPISCGPAWRSRSP